MTLPADVFRNVMPGGRNTNTVSKELLATLARNLLVLQDQNSDGALDFDGADIFSNDGH